MVYLKNSTDSPKTTTTKLFIYFNLINIEGSLNFLLNFNYEKSILKVLKVVVKTDGDCL